MAKEVDRNRTAEASWRCLAAGSVLLGLVAASFALWDGVRHNSQSELVDTVTGAFDFSYGALLFSAWLITVSVGTFAVAVVIRKLAAILKIMR